AVGQARGSAAQAQSGRKAATTHAPDAGARRAKVRVLTQPSKNIHHSLHVTRGDAHQAQPATASSSGGTWPSPESVGVSTATLNAIASCESGGDPTAVSADGAYRGKYQFDY